MGYVHQRKTYRLIFEGELAGLEVVARSTSAAAYKRISGFANREWSNPPSDEDLAEFEALGEAFAAVLVEWNLEEEVTVKGKTVRKAVPPTLKGFMDQDLELVQAIVLAWMDAVAGPAAVSADIEASLPQESLPA
jgi:hypothetical protein